MALKQIFRYNCLDIARRNRMQIEYIGNLYFEWLGWIFAFHESAYLHSAVTFAVMSVNWALTMSNTMKGNPLERYAG